MFLAGEQPGQRAALVTGDRALARRVSVELLRFGVVADGLTAAELTHLERLTDAEADGDSSDPSISPDGRWVSFWSLATNLVPDDTNDRSDVFLVDRLGPTLLRVSVGSNGELLAAEILKATGIEVSYVPVSGGVGEIIPQVAGGHIDAAISGFSLLDGDQLRPLALSGTEEHEDFPDVPTFDEAGYPGVELVTSWGLILPPETPQEIVDTWNAAVQEALQDEGVQQAYDETSFIVLEQDAAAARAYFEEQHEVTQAALGQ